MRVRRFSKIRPVGQFDPMSLIGSMGSGSSMLSGFGLGGGGGGTTEQTTTVVTSQTTEANPVIQIGTGASDSGLVSTLVGSGSTTSKITNALIIGGVIFAAIYFFKK